MPSVAQKMSISDIYDVVFQTGREIMAQWQDPGPEAAAMALLCK